MKKSERINKAHKEALQTLTELEALLTAEIAETDNGELMDLFNQWMEQRNFCNEGYLEWLKAVDEESVPGSEALIKAIEIVLKHINPKASSSNLKWAERKLTESVENYRKKPA